MKIFSFQNSIAAKPHQIFTKFKLTSFQMKKNFMDLIWDYVVFAILVIVTTVVPLLGRYIGTKKRDTSAKADYVFAAGSSISIVSMMLSVARGTLGVRSFLGYPSEIFYRGSGMWETLYGMVNSYPIVCYVFIPVYFSLGITSVYQYIDQR
jgi:sodium-coupled monocarboxylate transporter 8/12